MSNNISRKGLAWGALVAVAASLFAGVPAHAAAGLTLAANSSSQVLSVPAGTSFQLVETASSEITGNYNTLAVQVVSNSAGAALVTVDGRATASIRTTDSRVVIGSAAIAAAANNQTIEIRSTSSATATYTVTAWLDANANGAIDATEYSASQTVTFLSAADLTATTSFVKAPTYTSDARSIQVRTALTNVNTDQLALASVGGTGNSIVAAAVSIDLRSGTYDARLNPSQNAASVFVSGDARFYATQSSRDTIDISDDSRVWFSGAVFTAQAYWGTTKLGASVSTTSGLINNAATSIYLDTLKSVNAKNGDLANGVLSAEVRTNSAFVLSATIRGDSGSNLTGVGVKFAVGSANWVTSTIRVDVTANGATTSYTTSASLRAATWTVPADAAGNAQITVAISGSNTGDTNNDLAFTATSANLATKSVTVYQSAAAATTAAATPAVQAVVLGQAATVVATIKDQFGQAFTSGYVAKVTYSSNGSTAGSAASNSYALVTAGAASVSVTVDGTVTGATHYDVQLAKINANGSQTDVASPVAITIATRAASELAVGYLVGVTTAAARVSVDAKTLVGASASSFTAVAQSISGRAVITGDRFVPYAAVTITGAGLYFVNTSGTFDAGTTTTQADANGYFTVTVRSNTSTATNGASAVVSSGAAAAKTVVWTVDAPAATAGVALATPNADVTSLLVTRDAIQVTFSARDIFNNVLGATYDNAGGSPTLSVHVSGDVTRDVYGVDTKGYLTVAIAALTSAGTAYLTATYSNDTRVVTKQVRVVWAKETVTVSAPDTAVAGQNQDVIVTVLDPAGNGISGVTVSASSVGAGYLTIASDKTDANGNATVKLFANKDELGWAYVTATSGLNSVASAAAGFQIVAPDVIPTATDSVATLTLAVPASAQAGTVVDVVATATDADGNPVAGADVSATSTGVGYLAVAKGTTDDNGQVTLKLVVGAGENGTASVIATSGSATADAAQVTAGVTDANITLAAKRVTVDWAFAANKKVVIVRDGVAIKSFVASSNAAGSFSFNLKSGTHKVSVKVGGVTIDSQSYKIK